MVSFELSAGGSLHVYFDAAGRDQLLALLAEMTEPGDHYHLFGPRYGGTDLSDEVHPRPRLPRLSPHRVRPAAIPCSGRSPRGCRTTWRLVVRNA